MTLLTRRFLIPALSYQSHVDWGLTFDDLQELLRAVPKYPIANLCHWSYNPPAFARKQLHSRN